MKPLLHTHPAKTLLPVAFSGHSTSSQTVCPVSGCVLPAAHSAQTSESDPSSNCPTEHEEHAAWPGDGWTWPSAQAAHTSEPSSNMPTAQAMQDVCPAEGCTSPLLQAVHEVDSVSLNVPAPQTLHSVEASVSTSAVPPSHAVHDVTPSAAYVPARQPWHAVDGSPSVSAVPAGHSGQLLDPLSACVPAEHIELLPSQGVDGSSSSSWYPAGQCTHSDVPSAE